MLLMLQGKAPAWQPCIKSMHAMNVAEEDVELYMCYGVHRCRSDCTDVMSYHVSALGSVIHWLKGLLPHWGSAQLPVGIRLDMHLDVLTRPQRSRRTFLSSGAQQKTACSRRSLTPWKLAERLSCFKLSAACGRGTAESLHSLLICWDAQEAACCLYGSGKAL